MIRKYGTLFLLFAISFQPITIQAWNFQSLLNTTFKWGTENKASSLLIGTGLIGLGLFSWWYNKLPKLPDKGTKTSKKLFELLHKETKPDQISTKTSQPSNGKKEPHLSTNGMQTDKSEVEDNAELIIKQIEVVPQKEAATCGYHALFNALAFFSDYISKTMNVNSAMESIFGLMKYNFTDAKQFENILKNWKQTVIQSKKKRALRKWITEKLNQVLNKQQDFSDYYQDILHYCAAGIGENAAEWIENGNEYTINNTILQGFVNAYTYGKPHLQFLNDPQGVKLHMPILDTLEIKITPSIFNQIIQQYLEEKHGDQWLLGSDIHEILRTKIHVDEELNNNFVIVDDIDQLPLLSEEIKSKWQASQQANVNFLLGTMKEKGGGMGHWFTLSAQKINGKSKYLVGDSLNPNRKNDERVHKVIKMLNA
ncbi:MAG: hypothetical protein WDZ41_04205 [Candidatus Babeliales bacterium]